MKKIYSLVLMAAMLLVGTHASAKEFTGTSAAELQKAVADIIYGVETDSVIKLMNPVILNQTIWVGTQTLDGPYKTIEIDLNGNNISYPSDAANDRSVFALTHGKLKIVNNGAEAKVQLTGKAKDGATVISVYGSYKSSRWNANGTELVGEGINTRKQGWCSHLWVGPNVLLYAEENCQGTGLYVGTGNLKYPKANGDGTYSLADVAYKVSFMKTSGWGFAHGIRVDFLGKINFQGDNSGKAYGIKVNGTTRSPLSCADNASEGIKEFNKKAFLPATDADDDLYLTNYYNHNAEIDKNATLATDATHKRDTVDAPFVWIHEGAEIKVRKAGSKVTALYGAGYAKWLVQGYAEGKTGMYVSAGVMNLNDAYVKSTAEEWQSPDNAGSANGGGSGVVINTRDSYAGGIEFTVSGDTHIESIEGYAIEEIVNTTPVPNPAADPEDPSYDPEAPATIQVTKVANISIEGGTLTGGDEGAIVVSTVTLKEAETKDDVDVVVYGGNVIGESYAGDKGAVTTGSLQDLIPTAGYHVTEVTVTDPVSGQEKTVIVVSEGGDPTPANAWTAVEALSDKDNPQDVAWEKIENTTMSSGTVYLGELQINKGTAGNLQELTIPSDGTLQVNRLIMNQHARIIVEAGGKLIVKGSQGINAPSVDNILLKTSEAAQAHFLFHPNVSSNRHPSATVELKSKAYRKANGQYVFQRFGVPSYMDTVKRAQVGYTVPTAIYRYDYEDDGWKSMASADQFVPFQCYELTTQQATSGEVYTFKCPLAGNENVALKLQAKWNYYANSYSAPINIKQMINRFKNTHADAVDPTVYLYDAETNWWTPLNNANYLLPNSPAPKEIAPMQAFIFMRTGAGQDPVINYGEHIWTPLVEPSNNTYAPVRGRQTVGTAVVEIADANGKKDQVMLFEGEQFSADFDLSYDAEKYLNSESFNIFVEGEAPMQIVATDDLNGTTLSMSSKTQTSFTMTISNVSNMNYAIRDMLTGTETEIVEGATYMFSVPENANVEGRFQIVPVAKMPTAIDNIEETAAVKGIYTITGQYVGTEYHNLPNGVYVVDGKKIVK